MRLGMRASRGFIFICAFVLPLLVGEPATATDDLGGKGEYAPPAARQWILMEQDPKYLPHGIRTGEYYVLRNERNESKALEYGQRDYGVNLTWGIDPRENVAFARPVANSVGSSLRFLQRVSIEFRGQGHLVYRERDYGINLELVRPGPGVDIYQWELRSGGPSDALLTKGRFALFNTVTKDYLVYGDRKYGINLKWLRDTP